MRQYDKAEDNEPVHLIYSAHVAYIITNLHLAHSYVLCIFLKLYRYMYMYFYM